MKRNLVRLSVLFALVAVMPQMSRSPVFGQNANSSTTMQADAMPTKVSRCNTKCRKAFGKCTRRPGDVRRRCIIKYRTCLRHCGR